MSEQNSIEQHKPEEMEFVRIFTPIHIPEYLVDQIRDKEFTTERFYEFQKICCMRQGDNGQILNPLNFLYVVVNSRKETKGFLWAQVCPLTNTFFINNFSMDKEYWNKGAAVKLLEKKVKEIIKDCNISKVYWITNFPKHSERYGFKRSKGVLMEYKEKKDGDIENTASRASKHSESRAV